MPRDKSLFFHENGKSYNKRWRDGNEKGHYI